MSEPIVAAFVDALARLTKHETIVQITGTTKLHMFDMMSAGTFANLCWARPASPRLKIGVPQEAHRFCCRASANS